MRQRRRNADVDLRRLARRVAQGDTEAEDELLAAWLRTGGCSAFAARIFNDAFEGWAEPVSPPSGEWEARDQDDRRRELHFHVRYWRLAMHPNRIQFGNLGVVWPLGEALTPTGERPKFSCATFVSPSTSTQRQPYHRSWMVGKPDVSVLELAAKLQDVVASYDERMGWGRAHYDTRRTLGLGTWNVLEFRLQEALSERFYESQGLHPLSGWSFDSPFVVEAERGEGPVEVQELPTERIEYGARVQAGKHQALTFPVTIRITHSLEPTVLIRTPRPDNPAMHLDLEVPNPIRRAALEAAMGG
jgi:hypothetical protein